MTYARLVYPLAFAALAATVACHPVRKRGESGGGGTASLAVLPAESDKFPNAAKAITDSLTRAEIAGVSDRQVSKVSLEVVQLSIECVEQTISCYSKVCESLDAKRLLFAQIAADKKRVRVKVTLFDADTRVPKTAQRVFANEQEASSKIGELVSEATR